MCGAGHGQSHRAQHVGFDAKINAGAFEAVMTKQIADRLYPSEGGRLAGRGEIVKLRS